MTLVILSRISKDSGGLISRGGSLRGGVGGG